MALGGFFFARLAVDRGAASAITGPAANQNAQAAASRNAEAVVEALRPEINPREAWGGDLPVVGPIEPEDDVRFLLVHHTASTNDYGPDQVVEQIRGFYDFHTSAEKGWPDVAYNFFIDRFGGIWEARAGSIAGPVRGDATGGSQGHALLCSLIGDHSQVEVSEAAQASLVGLLAWLAERHQVDTTPGAQVDFVSRGSNRWPEGAAVTTATISGHRDMSQTSCPGDFAYGLLADDIPSRVSDVRLTALNLAGAGTPPETESDAQTATTSAITTAPVTEPPTTDTVSDNAGSADDEVSLGAGAQVEDPRFPASLFIGVGATVAAAVAVGAARFRRRANEPDMWEEYY